uniref:Uncharacterized protein n=1 Tax=Chromera velia CCMP2878 TaxID=1169474 RepID=A0A0G4H9S0_9ALVE|eukprot:Cvel_5988.t1-p1 / transcript=Cvel_5988.t1 / gene=Cvel_5988 / organism=Chromera_velia_CCMP2878 / gene_product=hypothetical protein / transcript_product=hypothetical protein / location=Cvel_scaffold286:104835-107180(-) / protein_length=782 / sequence_SO=supercontig / SO=protein_coding / is_pseudo=false
MRSPVASRAHEIEPGARRTPNPSNNAEEAASSAPSRCSPEKMLQSQTMEFHCKKKHQFLEEENLCDQESLKREEFNSEEVSGFSHSFRRHGRKHSSAMQTVRDSYCFSSRASSRGSRVDAQATLCKFFQALGKRGHPPCNASSSSSSQNFVNNRNQTKTSVRSVSACSNNSPALSKVPVLSFEEEKEKEKEEQESKHGLSGEIQSMQSHLSPPFGDGSLTPPRAISPPRAASAHSLTPRETHTLGGHPSMSLPVPLSAPSVHWGEEEEEEEGDIPTNLSPPKPVTPVSNQSPLRTFTFTHTTSTPAASSRTQQPPPSATTGPLRRPRPAPAPVPVAPSLYERVKARRARAAQMHKQTEREVEAARRAQPAAAREARRQAAISSAERLFCEGKKRGERLEERRREAERRERAEIESSKLPLNTVAPKKRCENVTPPPRSKTQDSRGRKSDETTGVSARACEKDTGVSTHARKAAAPSEKRPPSRAPSDDQSLSLDLSITPVRCPSLSVSVFDAESPSEPPLPVPPLEAPTLGSSRPSLPSPGKTPQNGSGPFPLFQVPAGPQCEGVMEGHGHSPLGIPSVGFGTPGAAVGGVGDAGVRVESEGENLDLRAFNLFLSRDACAVPVGCQMEVGGGGGDLFSEALRAAAGLVPQPQEVRVSPEVFNESLEKTGETARVGMRVSRGVSSVRRGQRGGRGRGGSAFSSSSRRESWEMRLQREGRGLLAEAVARANAAEDEINHKKGRGAGEGSPSTGTGAGVNLWDAVAVSHSCPVRGVALPPFPLFS